jgi:hypothetical protein
MILLTVPMRMTSFCFYFQSYLHLLLSDLEWELDTSMDDEFRLNWDCSCPSVPAFPLELVLWSFKPVTYQTGSFAELTPKFQTCGTRSHKFRAPSPTPNDWDPCAAYRFYSGLCHVVIDEVWLAFPQWHTISSTQRNASKSSDDFVRALGITQQELWRFRKRSRDNRWLAIPSPSDLRHKKNHIYHYFGCPLSLGARVKQT